VTLGALGWAIVHSVWQVAAVGAALAVFLRVVRGSTQLRYAASFGALILSAALMAVTAFALESTEVTAGAFATRTGGTGPESAWTVDALASAGAPAARWVALAWLAGVVLLAVRWAGGLWLVTRGAWLATRPARPAWVAWLRVVAARMGVTAPVELRESADVDTPTLVGHRRPVVVVPVPAFEALARVEAESVLAHELAHVRRGDFFANGVQSVVETLLFFHPVVRWMSRVVREEREQCCDDVAVWSSGSRLVYARALTRLELLRARNPLTPLTLGANGGSLLRRLQRLDGDGTTGGTAAARAVLILAALGALVCVGTAGSLVLPSTARAMVAARLSAASYTVQAHDPVGAFSVTFDRGRPTGATVGGVTVAPRHLITRGDSLFLPSGSGTGYFALRLERGGFTWTPRRRGP
jgi:beta-lactamase regulating signal transducer with metallopeptidase domain